MSYHLGDPLFIENDRTKFQIPSINNLDEKKTVDLIQLGFTREDFYAGYDWHLTNGESDGSSTVYASLDDLYLCSPVFMGAEAITISFWLFDLPSYSHLTFSIRVEAGTNPVNPDTDGDGLYDGWDDTNHNGIWDGNEEKGEIGDPHHFNFGGYGTNPLNVDTDGDRITDGKEVTTPYTVEYKGEPNLLVPYHLGDPLFIENGRTKFQIPSINNLGEKKTVDLIQLGFIRDDFYAGEHWYLTDGGSDGGSDGSSTIYASLGYFYIYSPIFVGAEMSYWFFDLPSYSHLTFSIKVEVGTDPTNPDTDGDGLTDYEEITTPYTVEYKGSSSWLSSYPLGSALFIENGRTKFQIPSINNAGEKKTVDLIQLGFTRDDFYAGYHWNLTNGGSTVYASLENLSLSSAVFMGAEMSFWSLKFTPYLTFSISADVRTNPVDPDTDGDQLRDDRDKNPLIYTNRYALVIGVTDFDFYVKWLTPDLSPKYPERVRDELASVGFQVTSRIGHVTFIDFCLAVADFRANIKPTDLAVVYINTHGNDISGYKIAFSDGIYLGSDSLFRPGIRQRLETIGPALDFLWLDTCHSWTFKTDGEVDELKNSVGDIVFYGVDGKGHQNYGIDKIIENALGGHAIDESCMIEALRNLTKDEWKMLDLYSDNLYIC